MPRNLADEMQNSQQLYDRKPSVSLYELFSKFG